MSFECSFSAKGIDYTVWIEDDGRVCYAYLLDANGDISGNVWLYNRGPAPEEFDDAPDDPPRNPRVFVADGPFALPKSAAELSAEWWHEGGGLYARVFLRKELVAILAPGTAPGWSVRAKKASFGFPPPTFRLRNSGGDVFHQINER